MVFHLCPIFILCLNFQESTLYWTDWNNPGLFHVNIDSTNFGVALENELHGLNGMEYVNMTLMGECRFSKIWLYIIRDFSSTCT